MKVAAFVATAALVLTISQMSSHLVTARLDIGETHVVNSFLHLTHVRNIGGVFGLFPGHSIVFACISSVVLVAFTVYFLKIKTTALYQYVCFGLIVGGGASNVLDRIVFEAVVDFINVQGIPYWHYVFNTADVAIHLGMWPLLIGFLLAKEGDLATDQSTKSP